MDLSLYRTTEISFGITKRVKECVVLCGLALDCDLAGHSPATLVFSYIARNYVRGRGSYIL